MGMRAWALVAAALPLSACSTVTLNGQDVTNGLTFAAFGAIAIATLASENEEEHTYGIPEDGCAECTITPVD